MNPQNNHNGMEVENDGAVSNLRTSDGEGRAPSPASGGQGFMADTVDHPRSSKPKHELRVSASPVSDAVFERARRHSRRVRRLKIVLPLLAVVMAVAFGAYSWLSAPGSFGVDLAASTVKDGKLIMANPKLDGYTSENRRYSMSAVRAVQDLSRQGEIDLENIDARIPISDEVFADIDSPFGRYNRQSNTLELREAMNVRTTDGMTAHLRSASIDLSNGALTSSDPLTIDFDGSTVSADSVSISENGKVMVFEKRVRVDIAPEKLKTAEASGGEDASN